MAVACIVFEDPFVDQLRPINLARPTCNITCGAFSLRDLLRDLELPIHYHARPHLRGILERDGLTPPVDLKGPILYLNASLLPDLKSFGRIKELLKDQEPFIALNDQRVTVAWCPGNFPGNLASQGGADLVSYLLEQRLEPIEDEFPTLQHTFDVIRCHEDLLPAHLEYLIERGDYQKISEGVFSGKGTEIDSHVAFDATDGPILLGSGVRIRPFSYLAGPVRVGNGSLVIDHAALKHGVVLGHTVKAGGEIEASIIEPYSNKQHYGFLGHAYVGSWVNLGAGTSNSDLKNTYGKINVKVDGKSMPTGMQFLGCMIGDYTKTAINTSIFTGKLIGVGCYVYGFVSTDVPSFTNYARSFGQVTEVMVEVAIKTQTRVSGRRKVEMTAVDDRMMRDIFELTRSERRLSSEQLTL